MERTYDRHPIFITNSVAAVIHLYTRHGCFDDLWTSDCFHRRSDERDAKQFIDQLEDQWTPAFLMALRDQITERLKEHDAEYGTEFAKT